MEFSSTTSPTPVILVIDDNEMVREVLSQLLVQYRVIAIESGESAVRFLSKNPRVIPDMVITDFDLPGWNGCDTLRQIRKIHPQMRSILLSGSSHPEAFSEEDLSVFDACFSKYMSHEVLEEKIRDLLVTV